MVPVRVAFDPALPVVVTSGFTRGGRAFIAGEPFEWRDLGMSEGELHNLWRCGMVAFKPVASIPVVKVTPGEHVSIETPQQPAPRPKHKRRW